MWPMLPCSRVSHGLHATTAAAFGLRAGGRRWQSSHVKTRVLVTGSEHPAGLAALRALDRAGFETWAALQSRAALGGRSRASAGYVDVPDPRSAPEGFVAA